MLSANQFLTQADLPGDVHPVQGKDPQTVSIDGGSTIVSPLGEVLAGPLHGTGGVLVADLDLDTVGHYARPDVFALTVNEPPRATVHATGGETRERAERPVRA